MRIGQHLIINRVAVLGKQRIIELGRLALAVSLDFDGRVLLVESYFLFSEPANHRLASALRGHQGK